MHVRVIFVIALALLVYILPPGGFSAWSFKSGVRWLYLFIISFLIYNLLNPFIVKLAYRIGAVDHPGGRKIHTSPTPRVGGVGIFLAFVFTVVRNFQFSNEIYAILIGSLIIFIIGFLDDIMGINALIRLLFQVIAALIVVFNGISIKFPLSWGSFGEFLSVIVSVLWIVGIVNTFNFIDGIDGLAGSLSLIISTVFLIIVVNTSQYQVMFITASLCGAVAGFLIYNFHPAKIFLGDCGSTLIGFLLSVTSIYVSWAENNHLVAFSSPVMVLFIPVFDLIYTTISRIKNGLIGSIYDWLVYAGRDHIHHRIMALGFSVRETVLIISLINLLCGLISVGLVVKNNDLRVLISYIEMLILFSLITLFMRKGRENV